MIVAIHQPHFLPWAGYFNKLANADCFILLDNVQYRKNYFQNRTLIRHPTLAECKWLTVPVHAKLSTDHQDIAIADPNWRQRALNKIHGAYRNAPYFDSYFGSIEQLFLECADLLVDVNFQSLRFITKILDLSTTITRASTITTAQEPNRLLALCRAVGATGYITGEGWGEHNTEVFEVEGAGIRVHRQKFRASYQDFASDYYSGCFNLSTLDLLFQLGPAATSKIVQFPWRAKV
ncbi:MAG: WbqC family protein [Alphaproteobacteria bacterium]